MRLESKLKISRLSKYAILLYAAFSLYYMVTYCFSPCHSYQGVNKMNRKDEIIQRMESLQLTPPKKKTFVSSNIDENIILWPGSSESTTSHSVSIESIKSKIFSGSLGLDNVIPYYFKASRAPKPEDITLATLVTRNRFRVLSRLASNYKGPISAAIHVMDDTERTATIKELKNMYRSNPDMQKYVDIHLIIDKYDRQFNMWRNTAKLYTRSEYLMMLDVDFHLCTNFRKSIWGNPRIADMLRSGKTALVIPAFEYANQKDGNDWRTFPTMKTGVLKQVNSGKLTVFHANWTSGHGATDYEQWYGTDEIYPVTQYEFSYEPYVIYKKEGTPWCDERFIGYGANKAACLFEIFISGVDYYVLPKDFLIHQSHSYANHDRTRERTWNRVLYDNFRTEVCLRYSRKYVTEDRWYTDVAKNMKQICTDIPKWKYLSGLSKEQREADKLAEAAEAARLEQERKLNETVIVDMNEVNSTSIEHLLKSDISVDQSIDNEEEDEENEDEEDEENKDESEEDEEDVEGDEENVEDEDEDALAEDEEDSLAEDEGEEVVSRDELPEEIDSQETDSPVSNGNDLHDSVRKLSSSRIYSEETTTTK
ncbi:glycosyl-transferase for dystroglycan-domain-containing protein [Pilobolus umbonatus]|nr:glycosyl-transferase for dystroglycan-domain-containing protein [Pilobolus umbonatus]